MSFWNKVKKFLRIGGAKARLQIPEEATDQEPISISLKIIGNKEKEKISKILSTLRYVKKKKGKNDRILTTRKVIGTYEDSRNYEVKPGEEIDLNFEQMIRLPKDGTEKEGALGKAYKLGKTFDKMLNDTEENLEITLRITSNYSNILLVRKIENLIRK